MKKWMAKHLWLAELANRFEARVRIEKPFVLDDLAPFSYMVDFDHRWPARRRAAADRFKLSEKRC